MDAPDASRPLLPKTPRTALEGRRKLLARLWQDIEERERGRSSRREGREEARAGAAMDWCAHVRTAELCEDNTGSENTHEWNGARGCGC